MNKNATRPEDLNETFCLIERSTRHGTYVIDTYAARNIFEAARFFQFTHPILQLDAHGHADKHAGVTIDTAANKPTGWEVLPSEADARQQSLDDEAANAWAAERYVKEPPVNFMEEAREGQIRFACEPQF